MKIIPPLPSAIFVATLLLGAAFSAPSQEKKTETTKQEMGASVAAPAKTMPYRGKVVSVDTNAKTFTIGKRAIKITEQTKITKQGVPATLTELIVGEKVSGSYWINENGSLEAKNVKIGAKAEAAAPKTEEQAETSPSP